MKTKTNILSPSLTLVALACFAFAENATAVSPAPDGGYPGGNTAEGTSTLFSLTTGGYNTGVGFLSLRSNTTTSFNTAIGAGTLFANTADGNTATGGGALFNNTTGPSNTATGAFALFSNTSNGGNTATGYQALFYNTGFGNTADGYQALYSNTTGTQNAANGGQALFSNTTGSSNTASGISALSLNTTGGNNTAVGWEALVSNTAGINNTAVGLGALSSNDTGNDNTAVGFGALAQNPTGAGNIGLGQFAGCGVATANNVIAIGVDGADVSNSCYIGNISGAPIDPATAAAVGVDETGKLGTNVSSRRFKRDIQPMNRASEAILALKPVTFHYKSDAKSTPCFGLIAEEVAQVNPDLVVRDKNGEIYSVRYEQVNAMLLNEFLKEHRKVQEFQATAAQQDQSFQSKLAEQEKRIEALTTGLQKVSAQIETNRRSP